MKSIFISRNLKPSSPIVKVLKNHFLVAQSLIEFDALEFDEPRADWIFFYSRNGVKYFFEGGNYALYPYLWACLSEGTADELSHYVTDVSFIGNGAPEEVASAFKNIVDPNATTCFIRAKHSLDSVNKKLSRANDFSIPVYNNQAKQNIPSKNFDILIFTSPMNVDVWFQKRKYNNEQIIAIGNTTSNHLLSYKIKNVHIADKPSEQAIAQSLMELL